MKRFLLPMLLILLLFGIAVRAAMPVSESETIEVVLQERETLWDIAALHAGDDTDIRKYIYEIQELNHIRDPGKIQPGQVIRLPKNGK